MPGSDSSGMWLEFGFILDGKVTLTYAWWGNAARAQVTIAAIKLFEQQHPNITVKTEYSPFGDYEQKINTQAAGGNTPDVVTVDRGFQSEYAQRGLLLNLDKYVPGTLQLSGMAPSLVASGRTTAISTWCRMPRTRRRSSST